MIVRKKKIPAPGKLLTKTTLDQENHVRRNTFGLGKLHLLACLYNDETLDTFGQNMVKESTDKTLNT